MKRTRIYFPIGALVLAWLACQALMGSRNNSASAKGYRERKILTVVSNGAFSIVFDGDPSVKAVVIQRVDLGNGSRTIAMRLEGVLIK